MDNTTKTVLIIDDEEFIRQSFCDYFEDCLWSPIGVESAEAALALLEQASPQGAIVDIRLGGMNGNDFIRKAARQRPQMAFIICTGSPEYDIPTDVRELSCVSKQVFTKPITDLSLLEEELVRLIKHIESPGERGSV